MGRPRCVCRGLLLHNSRMSKHSAQGLHGVLTLNRRTAVNTNSTPVQVVCKLKCLHVLQYCPVALSSSTSFTASFYFSCLTSLPDSSHAFFFHSVSIMTFLANDLEQTCTTSNDIAAPRHTHTHFHAVLPVRTRQATVMTAKGTQHFHTVARAIAAVADIPPLCCLCVQLFLFRAQITVT